MSWHYDFYEFLTNVIGVIAVLIIAWGVARALGELLRMEISRVRHRALAQRERLRRNLAYYILLSMELLIAADMIRTIRRPTLQDLTTLAIIVGIRTATSFFLTRETHLDDET
ncbi:MAG: DUF1622 domain-containing protein [Armatimonadota bacterium]